MKIAVIVDGQAESQALPELFNRIRLADGYQLLNPIYADMQPKASHQQIARVIIGKMALLSSREVDRTIVLIDWEEQPTCIPEMARGIQKALASKGHPKIDVVVKCRKFENWLISDPDVFSKLPARFQVSKTKRAEVEPGRADSVMHPEIFLKQIAKNKSYQKRNDPAAICAILDPLRMAANSRSFRKFLRAIGHPDYESQSREPASGTPKTMRRNRKKPR